MRDLDERIRSFNEGRDPELLRRKYQRMSANPFAFFRGTCHLFYEDWPVNSPLNASPPVWISGDLHLENFGSYKGDNRLVYFGINDFDEASLAPCMWEFARFLTSILVAAHTLKISSSEAKTLSASAIDVYRSALTQGSARTIEEETADGLVKDLLETLRHRKRGEFLDQHTEKSGGKRRLIIDGKHTAVITREEGAKIESFVKTFASQQPEPEFFKLLDIAHRIAGTGSLGFKRYVLLVEGKGSPDHNFLLDLKEARASCVVPYLSVPQPHWVSEAERIVAVQKRVQSSSPAHLSPVVMDAKPYVLRELQPSADRVELASQQGKLRPLEKVIRTMAEVMSWGHLCSSGRQGSAIADELISFATATDWPDQVLNYAKQYADQVDSDYREFCARGTV
jgi:uncharacterized protein (DUF2252 family)